MPTIEFDQLVRPVFEYLALPKVYLLVELVLRPFASFIITPLSVFTQLLRVRYQQNGLTTFYGLMTI